MSTGGASGPDSGRMRGANRWMVPVLILAVLLAHGLALNADFYMDDESHILTRETGKVVDGIRYTYHRAVPGLAWDGIYAVFGASSVAFHAFNLLLHLAVTVSVMAAGRRLLARLRPSADPRSAGVAAFCGALLFATHPLMTEGVSYAQNASLQLVTLLTLGAVGFSVRFFETGRIRWVLAVGGCLLVSAFTKEVGLIYCGLSTALTWAALGGWTGLALVSSSQRGRWWRVGLGLAPLITYSAWYLGGLAFRAVQAPMWAENFFTQGRLFWSYARLMVWPSGLCADHLVPFSGIGLADPASLAATLAVGLLTVLLGAGVWFNRGRAACLLLLLGSIPLLMRFVYINKELLVEYRAYPAFPWIALAAGCAVAGLFRRHPKATGVALALVAGTLAVASARRSMVWSDAYQLALDTIRQYPDHVRQRTHLQRLDLLEGNWQRVKEVRDDARDAFARLKTFNETTTGPRKYEFSMPYRAYMGSEHFYALALTETDGSHAALEHTTEMLRQLERFNPRMLNPDEEYHEIAKQMIEIHTILRDHGAEYDHRRQARQAELLQSQAGR